MDSYYTDGSTAPCNPGPGGFAVIKNGQPYLVGSEPADSAVSNRQTTNIRMEGFALMTALIDADGRPCRITTDSQFWLNVLTKWASGWQAKGWPDKIKNRDIVIKLYELYQASQADLQWTRAHVGTTYNEMADTWANLARKAGVVGTVPADSIECK